MFSGVEYLYHDLVYKGQGCYWKGFTKKVGYDRRLKNNFMVIESIVEGISFR